MCRLGTAPHTLAFGAYLAVMTVSLALSGAAGYGLLFGGMLGSLIWLSLRHRQMPTPQRFVHAQAFFPVAMNTAFPAMAGAVPAVRPLRFDQELLVADIALFGDSPNIWLEAMTTPLMTEAMSLCYLFFMPLLFFNLARYFFWRQDLLDPFFRGLFTVYGIGFLGYLTVPAAGPYLAFPEMFSIPLDGWAVTQLTQAMVAAGSNRVDVFPSLHCAVSAYILGFSYRHRRDEFRWLLAPVAGLWLSTVYLRYHYAIDVVCGLVLGFCCLAFAWRGADQLPRQGTNNVHRT